MPIGDWDSGGLGRLSHGPEQNALVNSTIRFVLRELPGWRDRPDREYAESENLLNEQLCVHLDTRARHELHVVRFQVEKQQGAGRRVDIAAMPTEGMMIGAKQFSVFRSFLLIEGKRLPTPEATREREYVASTDRPSGGIQRFKLRLYGWDDAVAIIVGYIQQGEAVEWIARINGWITDLAGTACGETTWLASELLANFREVSTGGISSCLSHHPRGSAGHSDPIEIHHLWIRMTPPPI